ncbi:hypothetical protein FG386_002803 [Cryptosporidium ryanae]|uniref:uncharacterized protein n=1 Tax=Cryptosporidium ryanae TaxID=515981 RepID=UPI00351A9FA1|nr:hypothetical protein FG386_002803 [Cryptosporidium ryanae]
MSINIGLYLLAEQSMFKSYLIILIIILFTAETFQEVQKELQSKCSRSVSRRVLYSIEQLTREESEFKTYMKRECQLNINYHIYNSQETNKIVFSNGQVKCGICNQVFGNNNLYDVHMDEVHMENNNENEFICSEIFCIYFGVCEEDKKLDACNSMLLGDNTIINNCRKLIKNCFDLENKDSRIYELELSHKICDKNRILTLNKCINSENSDNQSIIIEVILNNFSIFLLLIIIISTFYISYKVNTYINKIK